MSRLLPPMEEGEGYSMGTGTGIAAGGMEVRQLVGYVKEAGSSIRAL